MQADAIQPTTDAHAIDRRFFRRKYDAEKVLQQFAGSARDETDLDALTAELLRVIRETMEPEHVSLWLRGTTDNGRQTTDHRRRKEANAMTQRRKDAKTNHPCALAS